MTVAFIAHPPVHLKAPPRVIVWSTAEREPRALVYTLDEWKVRFPRVRLLPVEVSERQWELYTARLAQPAGPRRIVEPRP